MAPKVLYSVVFQNLFDNNMVVIRGSETPIALPEVGQAIHLSGPGVQVRGTVERISYELSIVPGEHGAVHTITHGVMIRRD